LCTNAEKEVTTLSIIYVLFFSIRGRSLSNQVVFTDNYVLNERLSGLFTLSLVYAKFLILKLIMELIVPIYPAYTNFDSVV